MPLPRESLSLLPSALVLGGLCAGGDRAISPEALERAGFTRSQVDRYLGRCRSGSRPAELGGAAAHGPAA
jgi:hypothetical protein